MNKNNDEICRKQYNLLDREFRQLGFITDDVRKNFELCYHSVNKYYISEMACKPTGIALGCPLPDQEFTEQLLIVAEKANYDIINLYNNNDKSFAFVPPDSYHTTIVNRTHFETDSTVITMTEEEREKVRVIIRQSCIVEINVHFKGLIMTRSGRLIIPGFPDEKLDRLRGILTDSFSFLRSNVPHISHIKLGHVLAPLKMKETGLLLQSIDQYGKKIDKNLIFPDVYTPVGRISFEV
jgi:hypothetical protein